MHQFIAPCYLEANLKSFVLEWADRNSPAVVEVPKMPLAPSKLAQAASSVMKAILLPTGPSQ